MKLPNFVYKAFKVFGVGGGWRTPFDLCVFLSYFMPQAVLHNIDGGDYEARQRHHEYFNRPGNKASVQTAFLRHNFPGLAIEAVPKYVGRTNDDQYVTPETVITSGDIVFLQVDNDQTRNIVSEFSRTLDDITLISGATDGADQVRILVYLRRNSRDLTPPLSACCDKIAHPKDQLPSRCQEKLGELFHPFTMMTTSTLILNAFYEVWKLESAGRLEDFPYSLLFYDIGRGLCRVESPATITQFIKGGTP